MFQGVAQRTETETFDNGESPSSEKNHERCEEDFKTGNTGEMLFVQDEVNHTTETDEHDDEFILLDHSELPFDALSPREGLFPAPSSFSS
jgi:hypothetical protein